MTTVSPVELCALIADDSEASADALALLSDEAIQHVASTDSETAQHWLRVWRIKRSNAEHAGTQTTGFDDAFTRLARLPPDSPLSLTCYEVCGTMGIFWIDAGGHLVAFAVLKGTTKVR